MSKVLMFIVIALIVLAGVFYAKSITGGVFWDNWFTPKSYSSPSSDLKIDSASDSFVDESASDLGESKDNFLGLGQSTDSEGEDILKELKKFASGGVG